MASLDIIKASAGSGKTYRLAYSFIKRLIINPKLFHEILAVTFTNKATCQMKDRILANLQKLKLEPEKEPYIKELIKDTGNSIQNIQKKAAEAQLAILADYNRFSISTIDKFFTKIVRSFFNELHKDPSYEVVIATNELLDKAIMDVILDPGNSKLLKPIFEKRINSEKNFDIKPEIETIKSLILNHGDFEFDYNVLKSVFDKDKEDLDKQKQDIISLAGSIVGYLLCNDMNISDYIRGQMGFASNVTKIANGKSLEIGKSFLAVINGGDLYSNKCKKEKRNYIDSISERLIADLKTLKENIELYTRPANTSELIEKNINFIEIINVVKEKYKENCQKDHLVAINEMPNIVSDIANNELLEFLYMKIDARLKSIMIDEFQDTSTEQWEGFRPIMSEICSSLEQKDSDNLIIGDIKQAIYRWRGGNEALLRCIVPEQFNDYVKSGNLDKNYRSKENIILFNNSLFESIKRIGIDIDDIKFDGKNEIHDEINELIKSSYSDSEQGIGSNTKGGYIECTFPDSDTDIAEYVCGIIYDVTSNHKYSYKDIAVIIRNNKDALDIAKYFSEKGIDFISGESLILDNSNIVHSINTLLYLALNPDDAIKIAEYNICCGRDMTTPLSKDILKKLKKVSKEPIIEAVAIILEQIITEDTSNETSFLDAFLDIVYQKQTKDSMSLVEFVKWWEENKNKCMLSSPEGQNAVTIITIHKSKGLEYPVVIAPRVNWPIIKTGDQTYMTADKESKYHLFPQLPISLSSKCYNSDFKGEYLREIKQQIIDNINLLYVLVTRAGNRLYMICPVSSRTKSKSIGTLIKGALEKNNIIKKEGDVFWYGNKEDVNKPKNEQGEDTELIESINPIRFNKPLSKSSTIIESGNTNTTNLLQGILMHDVLSKIKSLDQLDDFVKKQCEIEAEDFEQFIPLINKIKSRPEMQEWFSPKWQYYTERGILIPSVKENKRPDRVIVEGNNAIVIDYKFGTKKLDKYSTQVKEYMAMVSRLGYENITGYIYYVSLDEIEKIE